MLLKSIAIHKAKVLVLDKNKAKKLEVKNLNFNVNNMLLEKNKATNQISLQYEGSHWQLDSLNYKINPHQALFIQNANSKGKLIALDNVDIQPLKTFLNLLFYLKLPKLDSLKNNQLILTTI